MPTHKPARIRRTLLAVAAALITVIALLMAGATDAHAATAPVYKGTGWKAETSLGIYSLSPDPYTIVFADTTARSKLAKYFTGPTAQVTTAVGVPITVTTLIDTTPVGTCPARHRIVVHYTYRPNTTKGMSRTDPCHASSNGSAWGGHIRMDSEYWTSSTWFSKTASLNEAWRKDAVTHELGHVLGLDHPNLDLNKDGVVASQECVKSAAGRKPVMCSKSRGQPTVADGGKFTTEYDLPGLKQLLANYTLRQT
ncbi:hypothetical protein [Streptomyces sp. NPDC008092]|uniref:hypothetical protein n=1 Tax=Streptomyces sp. NPDC008092 TaxID=3364808 RepID=UPI0036E6C120